MELEYKQAVNGTEVGEGETSRKNPETQYRCKMRSLKILVDLVCCLLYTSVIMFAELIAHFRNLTPKGIS